jgi:hypothetical protein
MVQEMDAAEGSKSISERRPASQSAGLRRQYKAWRCEQRFVWLLDRGPQTLPSQRRKKEEGEVAVLGRRTEKKRINGSLSAMLAPYLALVFASPRTESFLHGEWRFGASKWN